VLVFTRTTAFGHAAIEDGVAAIRRLGAANGFTVEATEDPTRIEEGSLGRFQVVVFLSSTGEPLDPSQQESLRRWVEGGGGWVGVHAAADAMYDWPWYGRSWYTALGHTKASWSEPLFLAHVLGGIRWAAGSD
jgi:type 1 glutamine amidotransferase